MDERSMSFVQELSSCSFHFHQVLRHYAFILTFTNAWRMRQIQEKMTAPANTWFKESEENAPKGHKTSNSPVKNLVDVRRWLCGRTFIGCLHVLREGLRPYVLRSPGRTGIDSLTDNEWKVKESLNGNCTKNDFLCSI